MTGLRTGAFLMLTWMAVAARASGDSTCDAWHWANPRPWGTPVSGVVAANGLFYAYGGGEVRISPDGVDWTVAGQSPLWGSAVWTGSQFAGAAGFEVGTSPDGVHWRVAFVGQNLYPPLDGLRDIASNGTAVVAVGFARLESGGAYGYGLIVTSSDGVHWSESRAPQPTDRDDLDYLVWAGNQFIAMGFDVGGEGFVLRSPDGVTWTRHPGPAGPLAWNGQLAVAIAGRTVWSSSDGVSWEQSGVLGNVGVLRLLWDGTQFVGVGYHGGIVTSPDGSVWSVRSSGTTDTLRAVAANGSTIVAAGDTMVTSSDGGVTWSPLVSRITRDDLAAVAWGGGRYVAAGGVFGGHGTVVTSPDGLSWSVASTSIPAPLAGLAWSGSTWVGVGDQGTVVTSPDGATWQAQESGTSEALHAVAWGDGQLVAVGAAGTIIESPDGATWLSRTSGTAEGLSGVTWGGGQFVAVGGNRSGVILTSPDGASWTAQDYGSDEQLETVAWGAGRFVATGYVSFASSDGVSWQEVAAASASGAPAPALTWWQGRFFLAGTDAMLSSPDGLAWTREPAPEGAVAALAGGERLVAVGALGAILWSQCGPLAGPLYLPAVGHLAGANGSLWRSDLELHNPGTTGAALTVELLPRDQSTLAPATRSVTLAAGTSRRFEDVVRTLFEAEGAATLRVAASSGAVEASARSYTDQGQGTFGQLAAGRREGEAVGRCQVARLLHLSHSADPHTGSRTNLGLVNATAVPLAVAAELRRADGTLLGTRSYELGPYESTQDNGVLGRVTGNDVPDAYALVSTSTEAGRFFPYASVVDNRSNDPVMVDPATRQQPACNPWELTAPLPGRTLSAITHADDGWLAVGEQGAIVTSGDGLHWESRASGVTADLNGVSWNGVRYVAVGFDGTVLSSEDGVAWTVRRSVAGEGLQAVTWTGGEFVAVGGDLVLTSPDGVGWTEQTVPSFPGCDVASNGQVTVAVCNAIMVSTDATNWRPVDPPWLGVADYAFARRVVWDGHEFLIPAFFAIDELESSAVYVSDDGLSWSVLEGTSNLGLSDLVRTENGFVGLCGNVLETSSTGEAWTLERLPGDVDLTRIDWDGTTLVAVGHDGVGARRQCALAAAPVYLPAAGHLPGLYGSLWRTDLEVHNPGERQVGFEIALLVRGQANLAPETRAFQLGPGMSARYPDVVGELFGFTGAATLRVTPSSGEVLADAMTYASSAGGTYGQGVAGLPEGEAIAAGEAGRLIQLSESERFRTNIGLVSASGSPMEVVVELFAADGERLGEIDQSLRPFESIQVDRAFAEATSAAVPDGYALVRSDTPGARFFAYASVVDNQSNDPTYVPASREKGAGTRR